MPDMVTILGGLVGTPTTAAQSDMLYLTACLICFIIVYAVANLFIWTGDTLRLR